MGVKSRSKTRNIAASHSSLRGLWQDSMNGTALAVCLVYENEEADCHPMKKKVNWPAS